MSAAAPVRRFDPSDPADLLRVRRDTDLAILLLAAAVVAVALLLQVTPDHEGVALLGYQLPEVCAARRMGATCPGCGLTRSFVLGVRFDPLAFRLHPLGPLLLGVVVLQLPYRGYRLLRARRLAAAGRLEEALSGWRWPTVRMLVVFVIALVGVWLVRVWS